MKKLQKIFNGIKNFFAKSIYNEKWRCNVCDKEVFEEKYFCEECFKQLPFINGAICNHCGRSVIDNEEYCSTCKNILVDLDKCRSVFNYDKAVKELIYRFKYGNCAYLKNLFGEYLYGLYIKNRFDADILTFIPMTKKPLRKRGYNQSQLLSLELSKMLNIPCLKLLEKTKETARQATMNRRERLKNLTDVFKVIDKKAVKDKKIMIVDDVTTTGSTAQAVAEKLKKAGAKMVYLLTIASVPPFDKY